MWHTCLFIVCIQPCHWNWERSWAKISDPQANILYSFFKKKKLMFSFVKIKMKQAADFNLQWESVTCLYCDCLSAARQKKSLSLVREDSVLAELRFGVTKFLQKFRLGLPPCSKQFACQKLSQEVKRLLQSPCRDSAPSTGFREQENNGSWSSQSEGAVTSEGPNANSDFPLSQVSASSRFVKKQRREDLSLFASTLFSLPLCLFAQSDWCILTEQQGLLLLQHVYSINHRN